MATVVFLSMTAAGGIRSVASVLIIPLEETLKTDRATISLGLSINLLLFGLCGPFAAAIAERFGMRRTMVVAFLTLGVAVGLTTLVRAPWQFQLLWGVVIGAGTGVLGAWMAAAVTNRWFVKHRGVVSGLLLTGGATGQIVFLPILAAVVDAIDWRVASLIVAIFTLLMVPIAGRYVRSDPREVGLQPYGATPATDAGADGSSNPPKPSGNPFVAAVKTLRGCIGNRNFLLLAGTFFACGASANGLVGTHLVPASIEHGIPAVTAAGFFSIMGVLNIFGTTAAGWLSDRYDPRKLLFCYYFFRGLSLILLPLAFEAGYPGLMLFVAFYGLEWAATAVPTIRLTADIFGRASVGTVFAWVSVSHQFGAGAISFTAGLLRTQLGDYHLAFMISGFICLIAAVMALTIRRPSASKPAPVPAAGRERTEGVGAPVAGR